MKIRFDVTTTYEIDVGCTDSADEAEDLVYNNADELIENGEAKRIGETIHNVIRI